MKNPLDLIRARLLADPAITVAVGEHIFLLAVPQDAPIPNIVVLPIGSEREAATLEPDDLSGEHRVVVDCRADTVSAAGALGELVSERLHGFTGAIDGVAVDRIEFMSGEFAYHDETRIAHHILDFDVVI